MIIDPDDHPKRYTDSGEAFADASRRLRDEVLADPSVDAVHVMVGPPGSGKSHWASNHSGRAIVDGCHADAGRRRALAKRIKDAGKRPVAVWVKTPPAECLRRNNKRQPPKRVPRQVIQRQAWELEKRPPRRSEGWAEVIVVE
jgi:predicted kinase